NSSLRTKVLTTNLFHFSNKSSQFNIEKIMIEVATIAYNNVAIQLSVEEVEVFLKLVQEVQ
ncbi:hypothetical protein, partial [Microcoleus sp. Pol7_A1]|uniref:hypothetical protein n=1 Tax=Microcoleus sp. Pol7_A1 TaxID=2818893 RepID=UPI002FCF04D6